MYTSARLCCCACTPVRTTGCVSPRCSEDCRRRPHYEHMFAYLPGGCNLWRDETRARGFTLLEPALFELERRCILGDRSDLRIVEASGCRRLDLDRDVQRHAGRRPKRAEHLVGELLEIRRVAVGLQALTTEKPRLPKRLRNLSPDWAKARRPLRRHPTALGVGDAQGPQECRINAELPQHRTRPGRPNRTGARRQPGRPAREATPTSRRVAA